MRPSLLSVIAAGLAMTAAPTRASAAVHLNQGGVYDLEFSNLPSSGFDAARMNHWGYNIQFSLGPDVVNYPDALEVDLYEDFVGGSLWGGTNLHALPGGSKNGGLLEVYYSVPVDPPFGDLQGVVHFQMLSGSADLSSVFVQVVQNGELHERNFTLPVPEPASLVLACLSIAGPLFLRRGHARS